MKSVIVGEGRLNMAGIIELLEQRDEQGLVLLKDNYSDYCYSIIYRLLRDHEQTEEALSDVWLQIWNSIPPARPQRIRAYLAKTARNTAVHYIERTQAQKRSGVTVLLDELEECIPDPRWEQSSEELKEMLRCFVHGLELEEQRIFLWRYWYGATIEELAKAVHCSENRITGILFRTRKKLRKYLEKEGYEV